ncbi:MAG: Inner spore coat protein, partial [Verrucomicrobiota bacterium]
IDIGEACSNVLIQGNRIYYNSDKGFSVGQASTVTLRKNLVVGCSLGVGIKDSGSHATIDQNTFVNCGTGVALYEKNFGDGGGSATLTNTIIAKPSLAPVTVDSFSSATISYSLSDTAPLAGTANLLADPRFVDPVLLNFQLQPTSPAINTGDPAHAPDPDLTIVDRGAAYLYHAADYPYTIGETVVINEILANSGTAADWIELHNRTQGPVDISGWFLSDDATHLAKYTIPAGTILPAGGYATFYEDLNFGPGSVDPNKVTAFALRDIGEAVHLSSGIHNELTDYRTKEDFGASAEGETLGTYYKPATDSYNFVAMARPSPAAPNSGPRIGPIVISEIMYNPASSSDADEYVELLNVTAAPVTLHDAAKQKSWRMTDGIDFDFPADPPITMAPGERILLVRNLGGFTGIHGPSATRKFQWTAGTLDNGGEPLQLAKPGGVDALNVTQFIRVDRVNYDDAAPWVTSPDGTGPALTKASEADYGNDFINWRAAAARPGAAAPGLRFESWATLHGVTDAAADDDGDGLSSLLEYAQSSDPWVPNCGISPTLTLGTSTVTLGYEVNLLTPDLSFLLEMSDDLAHWTRLDSSVPVGLSATTQTRMVTEVRRPRAFYRTGVTLKSSP